MLAGFLSWWIARLTELLAHPGGNQAIWRRSQIIVRTQDDGRITAVVTASRGSARVVTLDAAAALAKSRPVLLCPAAGTVLTRRHTLPAAPPRQLTQMLHHELARITPFRAEALFWQWDAPARSTARSADRSRVTVTLTMVPKIALAAAFASLEAVGLHVDFIDLGDGAKPRPLAVSNRVNRAEALVRRLGWACAALAATTLLLPPALQMLARHRVETAIAELQPAVTAAQALSRLIRADDAGQDSLIHEAWRTADALRILDGLTRMLPDDTFLTDLSLRGQQVTLSGRSASAPRLITILSADPAIHDAAFTAPVTRADGAMHDVFSLQAAVSQ